MEKANVTEIELNGIKYVQKDSQILKALNIESPIKIVVLQRGWIYIGRFERTGNDCKLFNSYCIRTWGTTKGLQELVNGATSSTKLDKCEGVVEFDWLTVIYTISVKEESWKQI